jgi:crossover junction endodeoxyribonuclease RuvC
MRIIGIDPGTGTTGFGVIDIVNKKPKFVDAGVIRTPAQSPLPGRLLEIFDNLTDIIKDVSPDIMSVEKLFFAQNVTTAISVSHARGVVILAGVQAGLEIVEYTPLQIKQALTGYGRASKAQIQEMVRLVLNLDKRPSPDDAADGLAAAITHSQVL